jgi:hypothetical protein
MHLSYMQSIMPSYPSRTTPPSIMLPSESSARQHGYHGARARDGGSSRVSESSSRGEVAGKSVFPL